MDFRFKRFGLCHDRCAMKVGTDGVLLGAWATGGGRILDVGCGCGLIALMMAQRFEWARVVGVEIDEAAAVQARENVERSPFADRVEVVCGDIAYYGRDGLNGRDGCCVADDCFDAVVCNPPFYNGAYRMPDGARRLARESVSLGLDLLCDVASRVLTPNGELSVIVPVERERDLLLTAADRGFHAHKCLRVRTKRDKPVKRVLLALGRSWVDDAITEERWLTEEDGMRSEWYAALTADFYL